MIRRLEQCLNDIKRKSVLKTWLMSYFAILIILLLLIIWAESIFFNAIAEDTENLKMEKINMFSSRMDTLTEECKLFALKLTSDNRFTENFLNAPQNEQKRLELKEAATSLRKEFKYINEFFIYLRDTECIISSSGYICTPRHYYDIYYKQFDLEYEVWFEKLLMTEYAGYQVFENSSEKGLKRLAKFCYMLPLKQMFNENAVVFTEVDFSSYENELTKLELEEGMSILIYDDNMKRYFEKGGDIPNDEQLKKSEGTQGFYETQIDGKKVVMNVVSSTFASWKYAFVIPYSVFWERIIGVKQIGFVIFALIAVMGILGILFMTNHNYKAVAKIIKRIESNFEVSGNKSENEYARINKVIDVASKYSRSVEGQEKQKRLNLVLKLLLGVAGTSELSEGEKLYKTKCLVVAVFFFPVQDSFKNDDITDEERKELMKAVIINIFTELGEKYGCIDVIDIDNPVFVFSPESKYADNTISVVKKCAMQTYKAVLEHFGVKITCGISNCVKNPSEMCVSYREALSALNTASQNTENGVNIYSKRNIFAKSYYYPMDQMQYIISLIGKGEKENALKQISIVFEVNSNIFDNKNLAKALVTDIASTIIRAAINVGFKIDAEKLMECTQTPAYETINRVFESYVDDICQFALRGYIGKEKSLVEKIDSMILENFKNTQFNVNMIANLLGMNPNSLSVIYKRKTGNNILENINKLRVSEAKLLLEQSDISLEEVATKSGFGSLATFRRVFKTSCGMSPAEYRKMNRCS